MEDVWYVQAALVSCSMMQLLNTGPSGWVRKRHNSSSSSSFLPLLFRKPPKGRQYVFMPVMRKRGQAVSFTYGGLTTKGSLKSVHREAVCAHLVALLSIRFPPSSRFKIDCSMSSIITILGVVAVYSSTYSRPWRRPKKITRMTKFTLKVQRMTLVALLIIAHNVISKIWEISASSLLWAGVKGKIKHDRGNRDHRIAQEFQ